MIDQKTPGISGTKEDLFTVEDTDTGFKLFYLPSKDGYQFQPGEVGFLIWKNEKEADVFMSALIQSGVKGNLIVKKLSKP